MGDKGRMWRKTTKQEKGDTKKKKWIEDPRTEDIRGGGLHQ